jgi:hypothetical protein
MARSFQAENKALIREMEQIALARRAELECRDDKSRFLLPQFAKVESKVKSHGGASGPISSRSATEPARSSRPAAATAGAVLILTIPIVVDLDLEPSRVSQLPTFLMHVARFSARSLCEKRSSRTETGCTEGLRCACAGEASFQSMSSRFPCVNVSTSPNQFRHHTGQRIISRAMCARWCSRRSPHRPRLVQQSTERMAPCQRTSGLAKGHGQRKQRNNAWPQRTPTYLRACGS